MNNCIYILLCVLLLFVIYCTLSMDHFKPINSLKIKYNNSNIIIPNKLTQMNSKKLLRDAELKSQPLGFENQFYSMPVYSDIGEKEICLADKDCSVSSKCDKNVFSRNIGVGVCTLKNPDKTVFDIKY